MKQKKLYLLSGFLALIVTTLAVTSLVSAATDEKDSAAKEFPPCRHELNQGEQEAMQAKRAAIDQVLATGDYEAWKSLVSEDERMSKMLEVVTEDNFPQFVQMHQLRQAGDWKAAQEIAKEIGLPSPGKFMKFRQQGERPIAPVAE